MSIERRPQQVSERTAIGFGAFAAAVEMRTNELRETEQYREEELEVRIKAEYALTGGSEWKGYVPAEALLTPSFSSDTAVKTQTKRTK